PDDLVDREIVCVGHPALDPRNDDQGQHKACGGVSPVKRLQPGEMRGRGSVSSFGKNVAVGTHDSSPLGGNSGSAVLDTRTGNVVALHFAGLYLKENYAVPMCDLAMDQRVVDCGLVFAATPSPRSGAWDEWWRTATEETAATTPVDSAPQAVPAAGNGHGTPANAGAPELVARYSIPLEITV